MQYITKLKLAAIHQLCNTEDKSTEYHNQMPNKVIDVLKINPDNTINCSL